MFVDKATITVIAGRGGDGAVSFHREKYIAAGGPDGGDGGKGGDVILVADDNMSTLMDFKYKRKYTAGNGGNGAGRMCTGRDGENLYLKVPRGTLVIDKETGAVIQDMSEVDSFVIARGGRGGWGNKRFATPTRQAPRFAKPGLPGQEREIILELKLLADVGLVGFPNVGKSTMLSVVSKANPKIANYHFTTLYPNLGVVYVGEGNSFVMADIPGLIEGASEGTGLGHDFLRHIERCRLIVHIVDVSGSEGRDPVEDFETINAELISYSPELLSRPQIVVGNKIDIVQDPSLPEKLKTYVEARGYRYFDISAAAHKGTRELVLAIAEELSHLPPVRVFRSEYVEPETVPETPDDLIYTAENGVYSIEGAWMERLIGSVNFSDYESRMYFERRLRDAGVYERLEEMGIQEGDAVRIYDLEFEYKK
jgi:GTP-binding protein